MCCKECYFKKIKFLEENGYILRRKDKKSEIYISRNGYEKLKQDRINYLNEMINKENDGRSKKYYMKLKDAIEKPELWKEFHDEKLIKIYY